MEILTYSLWFTLFWWVICVYSVGWNTSNIKTMQSSNYFRLLLLSIFIPAISMLLEYLIVR